MTYEYVLAIILHLNVTKWHFQGLWMKEMYNMNGNKVMAWWANQTRWSLQKKDRLAQEMKQYYENICWVEGKGRWRRLYFCTWKSILVIHFIFIKWKIIPFEFHYKTYPYFSNWVFISNPSKFSRLWSKIIGKVSQKHSHWACCLWGQVVTLQKCWDAYLL